MGEKSTLVDFFSIEHRKFYEIANEINKDCDLWTFGVVYEFQYF